MSAEAPFAERLMARAVGSRHGPVPAVHDVPTACCDLPGVFHAVAPRPGDHPWDSPAGGAGRSPAAARTAATGEALERYSAATAVLPRTQRPPASAVVALDDVALFSAAQRRHPAFPHTALFAADAGGAGTYTDVEDAAGDKWWVPIFLVGLGDDPGHGLSTSSGLAAGTSEAMARLRAVQELVERDALMATWLHGLPGRRVPAPPHMREPVAQLGGRVAVVNATPAFSPHPVALVAGDVPRRGRRRIALGAACRATWEEAVGKAFLEWCQGVLFAGVYLDSRPGLRFGGPSDVRTFAHHAAYYTAHPERWDALPLLAGDPAPAPPPSPAATGRPAAQLHELTAALAAAGVRLFWRDLTTADVAQVGVRVVRALSPDLTPIHCDESWPFVGGRAADLAWRYPWASGPAGTTAFPAPSPHPLG